MQVSRQVVEALFLEKAGAPVALQVQMGDNQKIVLAGKLETHINRGAETGVLTASLMFGKQVYKLLINRKVQHGILIYQLSMLVPGTQNGWRMEGETKEVFLLEEVLQNSIVTE